MTTGFSLLLMTASANTLLQTTVADDKRGRIMSLYTMAVTGPSPIGGLLAGLLADQVGAALTLRVAGLACLGSSVLFVLCRSPRLNSADPSDSNIVPFFDKEERNLVLATTGPYRNAS
jgi:predicted MFS family arabinose efflux permease